MLGIKRKINYILIFSTLKMISLIQTLLKREDTFFET